MFLSSSLADFVFILLFDVMLNVVGSRNPAEILSEDVLVCVLVVSLLCVFVVCCELCIFCHRAEATEIYFYYV